jgi:hypothetical protein
MSSTIKTWEDRAIITATGVVTVRDAMQAEIDELRAALQAQPVQEPINNRLADDIAAIDLRHRGFPSYEHDGFYVRSAAEKMIRNGYALYAAPVQPVQEPVNDGLDDWLTPEAVFEAKLTAHGIPNPKAQPVQSPPLTDEAVNVAIDTWFSKELEYKNQPTRMRAAIEAALKGKP